MIITIIRKPLIKSVCENTFIAECGGINIAQTRVGETGGRTNKGGYQDRFVGGVVSYDSGKGVEGDLTPKGRWPANFFLTSLTAIKLGEQSGILTSGGGDKRPKKGSSLFFGNDHRRDKVARILEKNIGTADRFFRIIK